MDLIGIQQTKTEEIPYLSHRPGGLRVIGNDSLDPSFLDVHVDPVSDSSGRAIDKQVLQSILGEPVKLSAFLEAIEHMEFHGAMAIMGIFNREHMTWNKDVHKHCEDEMRHFLSMEKESRALRLKMNRQQLAETAFFGIHMVGFLKAYVDSLLKRIFREVRAEFSVEEAYEFSYYSISMLIELRLVKIYSHFLRDPAPKSLQKAVRRLLDDEVNHLQLVRTPIANLDAKFNEFRSRIKKVEAQVAREFFESTYELFEHGIDDASVMSQ